MQKQTDFTSKIEGQQLDKLNRWLARTTRVLPPYEFEWGEILSLIDYRSGGDPEVIIRFKKDFPKGMDYKAYYEERRERHERLENQFKNAKPLSRFPQGFSPKTM